MNREHVFKNFVIILHDLLLGFLIKFKAEKGGHWFNFLKLFNKQVL